MPPGCFKLLFDKFLKLILSFETVSMETQRLRAITYGVFKTFNDLNPNFMKEIVYHSPNPPHRTGNLYIYSPNLVKFVKQKLNVTWGTKKEGQIDTLCLKRLCKH